MAALVLIAFGIAFIVLPYTGVMAIPNQWIPLGMNLVGALLLLVGGSIAIVSKWYVRASANQAFVKTGFGGTKVILDRGAVVIPMLHKAVPVSLETMKLEVERRGPDALIT